MTYRLFKAPKQNYSNREFKPKIREEYRDIKDPFLQAKQVALDHSNNGKCWWVYQHILNVLTYK